MIKDFTYGRLIEEVISFTNCNLDTEFGIDDPYVRIVNYTDNAFYVKISTLGFMESDDEYLVLQRGGRESWKRLSGTVTITVRDPRDNKVTNITLAKGSGAVHLCFYVGEDGQNKLGYTPKTKFNVLSFSEA